MRARLQTRRTHHLQLVLTWKELRTVLRLLFATAVIMVISLIEGRIQTARLHLRKQGFLSRTCYLRLTRHLVSWRTCWSPHFRYLIRDVVTCKPHHRCPYKAYFSVVIASACFLKSLRRSTLQHPTGSSTRES